MEKFITEELFSGEKVFELWDTYGFPKELTEEILKEKGWVNGYNKEEYERCMNEQRERSRKNSKFKRDKLW